jgi:hypothetical protein
MHLAHSVYAGLTHIVFSVPSVRWWVRNAERVTGYPEIMHMRTHSGTIADSVGLATSPRVADKGPIEPPGVG